jgi:hypothetical protein
MFKTMYNYWLNNKSRASVNVNLNLWLLNSVRQYAILSTTTLSYFISSLDGLKLINLKTTKTYYDFLVIFKFFSSILMFVVLVLGAVSML